MSTNVEKFIVSLGFNNQDIKQLKDLLKLQDKSTAAAAKASKDNQKALKQENALIRKKLQMEKLIEKARSKGIDVKTFERSLRASKKVETIEKRRLELEKEILQTQKRQTQEASKQATQVAKRNVRVSDRGQAKDSQRRFKDSLRDLTSNDSGGMASYYAALEKKQAAQAAHRSLQAQYARQQGIKARSYGGSDEYVQSIIKQAEAAYGTSAAMKKLNNDLREYALAQRKARMQTQKHNLALQGMNDSTRHMLRSLASVYAILGATMSINNVGQQFEAMQSAMLAATGTSEAAAEEIAYLDEMTSRLGLSLLDTSDSYNKFLFAAKGKLDQSETRELFTGLSELGTTLGVSKERMKLSMNAITQINTYKSAATVM